MTSINRSNVTLQDVANRAGCSLAVVSTVLNGSKGNKFVSEKMRSLVMATASEMAYRPHFAARNLARRSSHTLGVYMMPCPWGSIGTDYVGQLVRGIEAGCQHANYDLMVLNLTGQESVEACMNKLAENRVDGLILIYAENDLSYVKKLAQSVPHVVAVDTVDALAEVDTLVFDTEQAIRVAIEHLVSLGHCRIGFVGSCLERPSATMTARQNAFVRIMREMGLPLSDDQIFDRSRGGLQLTAKDHYCQLEGYWGARYFLSRQLRPTAIIVYSEYTAMGVYVAAKELGCSIPRDLAVLSFGYNDRGLFLSPMLTEIDGRLELVGRLAVERLVKCSQLDRQKRSQELSRISMKIPPRLTVRGSTDPSSDCLREGAAGFTRMFDAPKSANGGECRHEIG